MFAHLRADGLVQRLQAAALGATAGSQQRLAVPSVQSCVPEGRQRRLRGLQPLPQRTCRRQTSSAVSLHLRKQLASQVAAVAKRDDTRPAQEAGAAKPRQEVVLQPEMHLGTHMP